MVCPRGDRLIYLAEPETEGSQWPPKLVLDNLYYTAVVLKSRGLFVGI